MKRTILALPLLLAAVTFTPAASAEFLIGPRAIFAVPVPDGRPELGIALDMRVSNPTRMIHFGASLQLSPDGERGLLGADIGASWFLGGASAWVPYLGGGVQFRAMFFESTRLSAFAAQAQLGLMSSRAGRRRFFAELRAVQSVFAFGPQDSLTGQARSMPDGAYRFEPSVNVGFLF